MMTETLNREIEYYTWKRYKVEQHLKFLDDCKHNDIYPNFCRIPQKTISAYKFRFFLILKTQKAKHVKKNTIFKLK